MIFKSMIGNPVIPTYTAGLDGSHAGLRRKIDESFSAAFESRTT
jgi:hypothetical protein